MIYNVYSLCDDKTIVSWFAIGRFLSPLGVCLDSCTLRWKR